MERLICNQVESVHIPVQMNSNELSYLPHAYAPLPSPAKKKIKK